MQDLAPRILDPFWLLLAMVVLLVGLFRSFTRCPALSEHRTKLVLIGIGIALLGYFSFYWVDLLGIPQADAMTHHRLASELSSYLWGSPFQPELLVEGIRLGNPMYRFLVGLFYAVSFDSLFAVCALNALLAYRGSVYLIEIAAVATRTARIPSWWVILCCLFPSVLFWTSFNLKEGIQYYAVCAIVGAILVDRDEPFRRVYLARAIWGAIIGSLVRPHNMALWLVAVGIASAAGKRKFALAVTMLVAAALALFVLSNSLGISLFEMYEAHSSQAQRLESRGAEYVNIERGVPLLSGIALLLVYPLPWQVTNPGAALALVEAWGLLSILLVVGLRLFLVGGPRAFLRDPVLLLSLIAFLLFAWAFSFTYNLGLLVRQRIVVVPALLLFVMVASLRAWEAAASADLRTAHDSELGAGSYEYE